jgi:hypothetical protein
MGVAAARRGNGRRVELAVHRILLGCGRTMFRLEFEVFPGLGKASFTTTC